LEAQRRRERVQAIQDTPEVTEISPEDIDIPYSIDEILPDDSDEIVQPPAPESEQPAPEQPTAADLHELVKQDKRNQKEYKKLAKDAMARAAKTIVDGLAVDDPGAWRLIYDRVATGERWEDRPNDVFELCKGIAEKIIKYHVAYTDFDEVSEKLNELLIGAGLKMPVF
jgi:hypothetical protein